MPKHLDQAAVEIKGKALILSKLCHAFHRFVIQANIEHRIHHARHRKLSA